jgi:hypothetical protein
MKNVLKIFLYAVAAASFGSCTGSLSNLSEFSGWIGDPENGCISSHNVNGLTVTIQHLPYQYLVARELGKASAKGRKDSLLKLYKYNLGFLITIKTTAESNPLYKNLTHPGQYSERLNALNFKMNEMLSLHVGENVYKPALTSLENTYGLSNEVKINVVFSPLKNTNELADAGLVDVEYADEWFGMGTLHALFESNKIQNQLPEYTGYNL